MTVATATPDAYVVEKVSQFRAYLDHEIAILESDPVSYDIGYDFLNQTITRIRLIVATRHILQPLPPEIPLHDRIHLRYLWEQCLVGIADVLLQQAKKFQPDDGSYWEDVRAKLEETARWVQSLV